MRIFKRADIEVLYSEGFRLRPLMAFGPALTLGVSSLTEYFDVRVEEPWEDQEGILKLLQDQSEKGLLFNSIRVIDSKEISIQEAISEFTYYVQVDDKEQAIKAMDLLNSKEPLVIESFNKKKKKYIQKDLKPKIKSVTLGTLDIESELLDVIDEVSPCKGEGLLIKTFVESGTSVRPMELKRSLEALGFKVERPIRAAANLIEQ